MPRLNIESENLLYITDFPPDVNWKTFKANVNRNGGGIKFVETFEAWGIYPVKDVILEFTSRAFLDDFICNLQMKTLFENSEVVYKIIDAQSRKDFCDGFLEKTGVDILKSNGIPPIATSPHSPMGQLSPRNRSMSFSNLNTGGFQKSPPLKISPRGQLKNSNFVPLRSVDETATSNTNNSFSSIGSAPKFTVNKSPPSTFSPPLNRASSVSNFIVPAVQKLNISPKNTFNGSSDFENKVNAKDWPSSVPIQKPVNKVSAQSNFFHDGAQRNRQQVDIKSPITTAPRRGFPLPEKYVAEGFFNDCTQKADNIQQVAPPKEEKISTRPAQPIAFNSSSQVDGKSLNGSFKPFLFTGKTAVNVPAQLKFSNAGAQVSKGIDWKKSTEPLKQLSPPKEKAPISHIPQPNLLDSNTEFANKISGKSSTVSQGPPKITTKISSSIKVDKTSMLTIKYKDAEMIAHERFGISHFPMTHKSLNKSKEDALKKRMQFKIFEQDLYIFDDGRCIKKSD
uniref:Uncharacterized protein n=1 Tax=Ditylenchus dipsaci TaxID=166011 RepID=A0A915DH16_9BILA